MKRCKKFLTLITIKTYYYFNFRQLQLFNVTPASLFFNENRATALERIFVIVGCLKKNERISAYSLFEISVGRLVIDTSFCS